MQLLVLGDKTFPVTNRAFADLLNFLADPVVDANGCHPLVTGYVRPTVMCPRLGRFRDSPVVAWEALTGGDASTGVLARCLTDKMCLNIAHMRFVPGRSGSRGGRPSTLACGNGHPWTPETTYWTKAIRAGVETEERQCKICRNARKRKARAVQKARETRWRAMGWTP